MDTAVLPASDRGSFLLCLVTNSVELRVIDGLFADPDTLTLTKCQTELDKVNNRLSLQECYENSGPW